MRLIKNASKLLLLPRIINLLKYYWILYNNKKLDYVNIKVRLRILRIFEFIYTRKNISNILHTQIIMKQIIMYLYSLRYDFAIKHFMKPIQRKEQLYSL